MKTINTILAAAMLAMGGVAGAVTVEPLVELADVPQAWHPVLNANGSLLLFTSQDHTGLNCLDMATGHIQLVDNDAAAGFNPIFAADGRTVIYSTAGLDDGLVVRDLRSFDLTNGQGRRLAPMTRNSVSPRQVDKAPVYAMADYKTIRVVRDGKTAELDPIADSHSYLWASLSPDGERLLFCEPFKGVFVSNADGTDARRIAAKGDYPCWAGNHVVVYIVSHDDGYLTLDSTLKATDLRSGETTDITGADMLVDQATAAANGIVVFATSEGKLFKTTVK